MKSKTIIKSVQRLKMAVTLLFSSLVTVACATVPSGGGAVQMSPGGEMSSLDEGLHFINPLSQVEEFDLRSQGYTERFICMTADGVPIQASDSLVTFHIIPAELIALDRQVGPNYQDVVIRPIVQSTVRKVLASYRWDQLNSDGLRAAQERISKEAAERLRHFHLILESVVIRNVEARLSQFNLAIAATSVEEQRSLQAASRISLAHAEAHRKQTEARGIVAAHRAIATTLTPEVLQDEKIKAWENLSTSPSAHVDVLAQHHSSLMEVTP